MSTRVLWDVLGDRQTAHTPRRSHRCVQEGHCEEQGQPWCRCVWRLCAVFLRQTHFAFSRPHCPLSQDAYPHPHPAFFCGVIVAQPDKLTITAFLSDSAYRRSLLDFAGFASSLPSHLITLLGRLISTGAYVSVCLPLSCLEYAVRTSQDEQSSRADTPQRDEQGKPYVLESVLQAEDILHKKKLDKEYLPITVGPDDLSIVRRRHV